MNFNSLGVGSELSRQGSANCCSCLFSRCLTARSPIKATGFTAALPVQQKNGAYRMQRIAASIFLDKQGTIRTGIEPAFIVV